MRNVSRVYGATWNAQKAYSLDTSDAPTEFEVNPLNSIGTIRRTTTKSATGFTEGFVLHAALHIKTHQIHNKCIRCTENKVPRSSNSVNFFMFAVSLCCLGAAVHFMLAISSNDLMIKIKTPVLHCVRQTTDDRGDKFNGTAG